MHFMRYLLIYFTNPLTCYYRKTTLITGEPVEFAGTNFRILLADSHSAKIPIG